jgi:hypothetical protein
MKFKFGVVEIITIVIGIIYGLSLIPYYVAKNKYDAFVKEHPNVSGKYGDPDTMTKSSLDDQVWNAKKVPNIIKLLLTLFVFITVCHQAYINIVA